MKSCLALLSVAFLFAACGDEGPAGPDSQLDRIIGCIEGVAFTVKHEDRRTFSIRGGDGSSVGRIDVNESERVAREYVEQLEAPGAYAGRYSVTIFPGFADSQETDVIQDCFRQEA